MSAKSTREIIESGKLKTYFDPLIIKALGHPIREHLLAVFNERIASGKEIAEELDMDVSLFYHHIEELQRLGCIELVETRRRRGVKERFYRATTTIVFDDKAWLDIPESVKSDLTASDLHLISAEVSRALSAGTLRLKAAGISAGCLRSTTGWVWKKPWM